MLIGSTALQAEAAAQEAEKGAGLEYFQEQGDEAIRELLSAREYASGCTALMRAAYQGTVYY
jgi:hypothetical protein